MIQHLFKIFNIKLYFPKKGGYLVVGANWYARALYLILELAFP